MNDLDATTSADTSNGFADATAGRPVAELGYAEAQRELDAIVAELERTDVDVDVLAARVQRASELIRFCRERISTARLHIERVVTDLDG